MANAQLNKLVKQIKAYIELEREAGIKEFISRPSSRVSRSKQEQLQALWQIVRHCRKCPLYKTKTHYVFGEGSPDAKLMFVGEAPGRDEDMRGLPFVGAAGQLLTKIIEAMGLKREEVYIGNILKCRPPGNRQPLPDEVEKCRGYIEQQIDAIKPKVICALGKYAAQSLLNTSEPITHLRGKFKVYRGINLMPTYHPAYLLRNPADKKLVWEDMKKIKKVLEQ